jgi:hypothetical protein
LNPVSQFHPLASLFSVATLLYCCIVSLFFSVSLQVGILEWGSFQDSSLITVCWQFAFMYVFLLLPVAARCLSSVCICSLLLFACCLLYFCLLLLAASMLLPYSPCPFRSCSLAPGACCLFPAACCFMFSVCCRLLPPAAACVIYKSQYFLPPVSYLLLPSASFYSCLLPAPTFCLNPVYLFHALASLFNVDVKPC